MTVTGSLIESGSRRTLVKRVVRAATPWQRFAGLLGRRTLDDDDGMLFEHCAAVHTLGMRTAIDVVFVGEDGVVVHVEPSARPWRGYVAAAGARDVIELAPGAAQRRGIHPQQRVAMLWDSSI